MKPARMVSKMICDEPVDRILMRQVPPSHIRNIVMQNPCDEMLLSYYVRN